MTSIDTHQQQQQKNQQQHTVQSSLSTLPPPLLVPRKRGRKKREENIDALNEEEGSSTQVANSQKIQKPLNRLHGGGGKNYYFGQNWILLKFAKEERVYILMSGLIGVPNSLSTFIALYKLI